MNNSPEFEEIMRRLRSRTPEELVIMSAQTEVELAEGQMLLERAVLRIMRGEDPLPDDLES